MHVIDTLNNTTYSVHTQLVVQLSDETVSCSFFHAQ